jgi:diacylglycerol kinase (ATP)
MPGGTIDAVSREVLAIVNPAAGRAKGLKLRPRVVELLSGAFPGLQVVETQAPGHATELACCAAGCDLVVAVGGDGTVREVAEGLARTRTELAVIPVGSCNDFIRTAEIPPDIEEAVHVAMEGAVHAIDLIRIAAEKGEQKAEKVSANTVGFGFDAEVIRQTRAIKRLHGMPLYLAGVFKTIRSFDCPVARIRVGEREWEQGILMVAGANGRVYGGGMRIAPEAELDDGKMELCIIEALGRFKIVRYLGRFVKGTHVTLKEVTMLRSEAMDLEFREPVPVQIDGDLMEFGGARRFRLEVMPGVLRLRVPAIKGAEQ